MARDEAELEARRQRLRRNLFGLGALELVSRVIGLGALVGLALQAIVASGGGSTMLLSIWLLLGLAYLLAASRFRVGVSLVSRELSRLEGEATRDRGTAGHPYRELPGDPSRPARGLRLAHISLSEAR
jgi:hypothetical protein